MSVLSKGEDWSCQFWNELPSDQAGCEMTGSELPGCAANPDRCPFNWGAVGQLEADSNLMAKKYREHRERADDAANLLRQIVSALYDHEEDNKNSTVGSELFKLASQLNKENGDWNSWVTWLTRQGHILDVVLQHIGLWMEQYEPEPPD